MSDLYRNICLIPPGIVLFKVAAIRLFIAAAFLVVTVTWARKATSAVRNGEILAGSRGTAATFYRDRQPVRFWLNVTVVWLVVGVGIASISALIFLHF